MIVDANILLYAIDLSSPFHARATQWLEEAINSPRRVGLPWQTIGAFLRISTHPRLNATPLSIEQSWSFVDDWLAQETVWIPPATQNTARILSDLLTQTQVAAHLLPDAQLAAVAIEHGVPVVSNDSDFARFPMCAWINPLGP